MGRIFVKVMYQDSGALKAATDADVTLIPKAVADVDPLKGSGLETYWKSDWFPENFKHDADGNYVPDPSKKPDGASSNPAVDPKAGEWLLYARKADRTRVVQRLTFTEKEGELRVTAGWDSDKSDKGKSQKARTCATVQILHYKKGEDEKSVPEHVVVTVVMHPVSEIVNLNNGPDKSGTRFVVFAEARRAKLYDDKKINDGTRVTFFDPAAGERKVTVKAREGWLVVAMTTAPVDKKDPKRIAVTDLYEYLNHVAGDVPDSIVEVSIFSHSYGGGPVIWNTYDLSGSPTDRDPNDSDARPKDFRADGSNRKKFPKMADALTADAFFKVWGCRFDLHLRGKLKTANEKRAAKTKRDEMFTFASAIATERTSLDLIKRGVFLDFDGDRPIYATSAAKGLGRKVWAAPPGAGASFKANMMMVFDVECQDSFAYLTDEFGISKSARDDGNYLDHTQVLGKTVAKPAFVTDHWLMLADMSFHMKGLTQQKWPAVKMANGRMIFRAGTGSFKVEAGSGIVDKSDSGHVYFAASTTPMRIVQARMRVLILENAKDASVSTGVYVTKDGKSFIVTRKDDKSPWTLHTSSVTIDTVKQDSEGVWDVASSLPAITNGVFDTTMEEW